MRHHQTAVVAAGALLLTAAVGLGVSTLLVSREQGLTAQALKKEQDARRDEERARRERALAQVDQLRTAEAAAVPAILLNLEPYRADVLPRLRELWAREDGSDRQRRERMRVGLALLAWEPETVKEALFAWMLETSDVRELELTRDVLAAHGAEFTARLWEKAEDRAAPAAVRFRAVVGLARFDPDNPRWGVAAPAVADLWLQADPLDFGVLTRALAPARAHLIGPLTEVAKGRQPAPADTRFRAASVLAVYAEDQPERLVDLLAEADERQFAVLFPKVQGHGDQALALLRRELERPASRDHPLPDEERDALAARQANVAAALLRLGQEEGVWPLLRHTPDPTRRTYLTLRLASRGVAARTLVERLEAEPEVSERRALVLALGEYDGEHLPQSLRDRLTPLLLRWYRDDPDPGVHGAVDWLLRHGLEGPRPRKLDWGQAEALRRIDEERKGKPAEGRRWSVNGRGMTLVHVPGPVEFLMGSPEWEAGRAPGNETRHRRRIGRSFALAARKVTVRDFQAFLEAHPEVRHTYPRSTSPDPDCPAIAVGWYEAAQYCRWLSEQEGVPEGQMCYPPVGEIKEGMRLPADYLSRTGYRLPTEAEWEYACRAGATTARFYGGSDELLEVYAWYLKNAHDRTWPVGRKRPNDFGLFDMHGTTWDWCQEASFLYPVGPEGSALDGEDGRDVTDNLNRALRGGSINSRASTVRCAHRGGNRPSIRYNDFGLRVARTL